MSTNPVPNVITTPLGDYVDASDLGLEPGVWPQTLVYQDRVYVAVTSLNRLDDGEQVDVFPFAVGVGELEAVRYRNGHHWLTVFND